MSKQSSVVWLWHNLTDDLIGELTPKQIHKIYNLVLEAEKMHKDEIIIAYGSDRFPCSDADCEDYYQETYGSSPKTSDKLGDSCNFYEQDNTTAMNCKHCGKGKWIHASL